MGLRGRFEEIERETPMFSDSKIDDLLAAVCEETDHDFTCFRGGKQVCQTCGEPYPFASEGPLPTAEDVRGILKDE